VQGSGFRVQGSTLRLTEPGRVCSGTITCPGGSGIRNNLNPSPSVLSPEPWTLIPKLMDQGGTVCQRGNVLEGLMTSKK